MREVHRRKKTNIKELILNHIYENLKSYIIVIIIFIIGIVAGVIFINNTNETQSTEIQGYINNFINSLKQDYHIDKMELIKNSLGDNLILIVSMWFIGSTVIGMPIVFGILLYRGFCIRIYSSFYYCCSRRTKRIIIFIYYHVFTKLNIYTSNFVYGS